eukprot:TRINITY_DN2187_c0_g2_i4.p1 TRINITY_DN2187_c0_g2~~TRINITY_DN2187_c0_g2_i4.p1  ORF type:complete len:283 (-),score=80.15 TRINITY_DN2187_c0_g2_i4:29-823(-)
MKNREAGVRVEGPDFAKLYALWEDIFESDWDQATQFKVNQTYSAADMAIITNKSKINVVIPPPNSFPGSYVTKLQPVNGTFPTVESFASPDYSHQTLFEALDAVKKSFGLVIYQVTDTNLCNKLIAMQKAGVELKLLFSRSIYSPGDWESALQCYKSLYSAGVRFRKTAYDMYTYTHAKFWVMDGNRVGLSTGNWSPTDFPNGTTNSYPPYGSQGWRRTNRDINFMTTNADVVTQFQTVLDQDYQRGEDWHPYLNSVPIDIEME